MPQNLSSYDAALKDLYTGPIRSIFNNKIRCRKYLKRGEKPWEGRQVVFPIHVQRSYAISFCVAGEALPATQNQVTIDAKIPRAQCWAHIGVGADVISASKTDRGAFAKVVGFETKAMVQDFANMNNRSSFGTGEGKIAEVKSFSAGTFTVTTMRMTDTQGSGINGNADNRFVRAGMMVDFYTSAGVSRYTGCRVTSVNNSNGTFVVTLGLPGTAGGNPAVTDGVYIYRPGGSPVGAEPMGMGGILDDGTWVGTLQNINRTSYPIFNSQIINAGTFAAPGALTLDLLQRAVDAASEGGNGEPKIIWCHSSVRREFVKLVVTDRRYTKPYDYSAGFKESQKEDDLSTTLDFDGIPFVTDKDCPWGTMFMHAPEDIKVWPNEEAHWIQAGSGGILQLVPNVAGLYQAQMAEFGNIGTDDGGPNSAAVIRFIAATVDRVVAA